MKDLASVGEACWGGGGGKSPDRAEQIEIKKNGTGKNEQRQTNGRVKAEKLPKKKALMRKKKRRAA